MAAEIGFGTLVVAFVSGLYGIFAAIRGSKKQKEVWIESARLAALCVFGLLTLAMACLLALILLGRYEVQYVFTESSHSLPLYLQFAALWGGQAGSLLFWCWLSAGVAFLFLHRHRKADRILAWTIAILLMVSSFFLGLTIFADNPFERFFLSANGTPILSVFKPAGALAITPPDGIGLNPLLRHPAMAFHPPALYLGFTILLVPFANLLARLITGEVKNRTIHRSRAWILSAWILLSIGLLLGSRWAYDVLGWGGYWGWDPVEVAALMPWLAATALLHVFTREENEQQDQRWPAVLVILTFLLVMLGTFLTRSGLVTSVHAFSAGGVGIPLLLFISALSIVSSVFLALRWKSLKAKTLDKARSTRTLLLWLTEALLMGIVLVCLWGVLYPSIAEGVLQEPVAITPEYYQRASGPLFLALVFVMGICPLVGWGSTTLRELGRTVWLPFSAACMTTFVLHLTGSHDWLLLVAGWMLAFAIISTIVGFLLESLKKKGGVSHPRSAWWRATRAVRRLGAFLVHLSVSALAVGIIGMQSLQYTAGRTIRLHESILIKQYSLTLDAVHSDERTDLAEETTANILVMRNDGQARTLTVHRTYYPDVQQFVSMPTRWGNLKEELYVVVAAVNPDASLTLKIFINPLVNWLWIGGIGLVAGGGLSFLRETRDIAIRANKRERA
jgi:cytochrome c-type biogenesis protein CcmF